MHRGLPFVPRDIKGCLQVLDRLLSEQDRTTLKTIGAVEAHFSLGTWIRNNWGMWAGSRLYAYFERSGLSHPEGQSGLILDTYVRYLRGESWEFEEDLRKAAPEERQWAAESALAPQTVDEERDTLAAGVEAGRVDLVEARLTAATAAQLRAALFASAWTGSVTILRRLLGTGVDIHTPNLTGLSVLMMAAGRATRPLFRNSWRPGPTCTRLTPRGRPRSTMRMALRRVGTCAVPA
jgi:hypothetical protein